MTSIEQTLAQAVAAHQAGRLSNAETAYRCVLALQPDHADALHLLGIVAHRSGHSDRGLRLIDHALEMNPRHAAVFINRGNILSELGRLDAATDSYRRAAELDRASLPALVSLGKTLQATGRADEAEQTFRRVRSLKARDAFAACVNTIAFETFSYCNRRCSYCPNSTHDRISKNTVMERAVFDKILDDLGSIDYKGTICFNGYNEPLSDPIIFEHITETRRRVPKATLHMSTNGDYLNREVLERLYASGLNRFYISIHFKPHETFTDSKILRRIEIMEKALGITPQVIDYKYQQMITVQFPFRDMLIEMRGIDWHKHGTNRGGLLEENGMAMEGPRRASCSLPLTMFTIQFNGNVTPCCQVIGDVPEHQQYVIGNIKDHETIFDLYAGERLTGWRRHLNSLEPKMAPCDTCAYGLDEAAFSLPKTVEMHARIMDHFGI